MLAFASRMETCVPVSKAGLKVKVSRISLKSNANLQYPLMCGMICRLSKIFDRFIN